MAAFGGRGLVVVLLGFGQSQTTLATGEDGRCHVREVAPDGVERLREAALDGLRQLGAELLELGEARLEVGPLRG